MKKLFSTTTICLLVQFSFSQPPSINQNSRGTTNSRIIKDNWSFDLSTGASFGIISNEKSMFRGNSLATKFAGRYQFGFIGLGFSGGLVPGKFSDQALNQFLSDRKLQQDQVQITSGKPSNAYLLVGPSIKLGNRVVLLAELQGGLFQNNPGALSITQTGVQRPVYKFEEGTKNLFPGFSGALQLAYPINTSTRFFINSDYFYSNASVRLLDLQSGIDIATLQTRKIQLFTAGIGITKTFGTVATTNGKKHIANVKYEDINTTATEAGSGMAGGRQQNEAAALNDHQNTNERIKSPRDIASGLPTGKRILPTNNIPVLSPLDAADGLATGRIYQPGQPVYGNKSVRDACGPVTEKITYPDGTTEEKIFACPDDAIEYAKQTNLNQGLPNRISMNVTVPKQTQGATFGEKVNAGLHAAGGMLSQGYSKSQEEEFEEHDLAARTIISGKLTWSSAENNSTYAIATNQSFRNTPSTSFGPIVRSGVISKADSNSNRRGVKGFGVNIYAREAGSGMASGKRTAREAGSGMASGRRQYQPAFFESEYKNCQTCITTVSINPLYESISSIASNPLNADKNKSNKITEEECEGVPGIAIFLLDPITKGIVAKTTTGACGDYWFANVPAGDYILKVKGSVTIKKQYEIAIDNSGSHDIAGEIVVAADSWAVHIDTEEKQENTKASINTTRSNIKQVVMINADTDGDGIFDSFSAVGILEDGSYKNLSVSGAGKNHKVSMASAGGAAAASYAATGKMTKIPIAINVSDNNTITAVYSDESSRDLSGKAKIIKHATVEQVTIDLDDFEDNSSSSAKTAVHSRSTIKTQRLITTDVDGDGKSETLVGGYLPEGAVITARMAGTPIGGIIVKGGKNPGGSLRTTQTNEFGEFEFMDMEPGNHSIYIEHPVYIDDETLITAGDEMRSRKGWDGTIKGGSVNTESTNQRKGWDGSVKGGGLITNDLSNTRKGWDGTVKGGSKLLKPGATYASILIEADLDGDGLFETDLSNSHNYSLAIDENENIVQLPQRAGISTSRSNIKNKGNLQAINDDLFINYGTTMLNGKEVSIKSVLKTKHDTAKNSVGNIR